MCQALCQTSQLTHGPNGGQLFFFKDFIYSFMREREREREAETQAEDKAGSMYGARLELDSGSPGSGPGLKAGTKPLSHPGIPEVNYYTHSAAREMESQGG